ncbi:MAG: hypothetical protein R3B47_00925 [Bacteroidia bacterium]
MEQKRNNALQAFVNYKNQMLTINNAWVQSTFEKVALNKMEELEKLIKKSPKVPILSLIVDFAFCFAITKVTNLAIKTIKTKVSQGKATELLKLKERKDDPLGSLTPSGIIIPETEIVQAFTIGKAEKITAKVKINELELDDYLAQATESVENIGTNFNWESPLTAIVSKLGDKVKGKVKKALDNQETPESRDPIRRLLKERDNLIKNREESLDFLHKIIESITSQCQDEFFLALIEDYFSSLIIESSRLKELVHEDYDRQLRGVMLSYLVGKDLWAIDTRYLPYMEAKIIKPASWSVDLIGEESSIYQHWYDFIDGGKDHWKVLYAKLINKLKILEDWLIFDKDQIKRILDHALYAKNYKKRVLLQKIYAVKLVKFKKRNSIQVDYCMALELRFYLHNSFYKYLDWKPMYVFIEKIESQELVDSALNSMEELKKEVKEVKLLVEFLPKPEGMRLYSR